MVVEKPNYDVSDIQESATSFHQWTLFKRNYSAEAKDAANNRDLVREQKTVRRNLFVEQSINQARKKTKTTTPIMTRIKYEKWVEETDIYSTNLISRADYLSYPILTFPQILTRKIKRVIGLTNHLV